VYVNRAETETPTAGLFRPSEAARIGERFTKLAFDKEAFMQVEVNGKSVKFCNGWRGVEGGICDCNSGMLETTEKGEMYGATIYLSTSASSLRYATGCSPSMNSRRPSA
jgi:hypothetical protein